ncbi:MAG: hypothetical protein P4L90_25720 [Rhodopila sp.]|nr:hypothetical protein [Rhodopila sp.]
MTTTLLLDDTLWDLCVDSAGNIAAASDPYRIAQDVATACRLFLGEYWYDTTIGIPYFQQILGYSPPLALIKAKLAAAAAAVPGCNNPIVYLTALVGRQLSGQVQFTDANGQTQTVGF